MRDAAYETQVLESRLSTHSRIAELLQAAASSPGDLVIVAQHHDLAADVTRAIPAYIAAAQGAQASASHTEATRLLDRAIELVRSLPEGEERDLSELMIRMLRTVSLSSLFGYGYPDVFEDFQTADRICRRLNDRTEIMPAQVGIWSYMLVRGEVEAAGVVLEPLTGSLDTPDAAWFAPEVKSCLGYTAFYQGNLAEARRWLEEAWAGYLDRPADAGASPFWPLPHDPVPVTAVALACVAGLQGWTAESDEWEQRALATAEQLAFPVGPFSSAFICTYLAWLRMILGDPAGARQFGRRTLAIAEQCRFDYFSVIGRQYVLVPEPELPADASELEQCENGMDLVGHGAFRPALLGIMARNHAYAGNAHVALGTVEDALLAMQKSGEFVHQPDLLRLRAEITATAHPERMEDVVADLVAAVRIGTAQGSLILALRAANQLARLPDPARPHNWSERLRSVLAWCPRAPPAPSWPTPTPSLEADRLFRSGWPRLSGRAPVDDDRAGCVAQHMVGDRSEESPAQRSPAPGPHHDGVGGHLLGELAQGHPGAALDHPCLDLAGQRGCGPIHDLLSLGQQPVAQGGELALVHRRAGVARSILGDRRIGALDDGHHHHLLGGVQQPSGRRGPPPRRRPNHRWRR